MSAALNTVSLRPSPYQPSTFAAAAAAAAALGSSGGASVAVVPSLLRAEVV